MNQNEALAHKSLARCHAGASQLKLWGALLFLHYSQTAPTVGGLIAAVGLLVEAPAQIFHLHQKRARVCACECVFSVHLWMCVDTAGAGGWVSSDSASSPHRLGRGTCGQRWCRPAGQRGRVLENQNYGSIRSRWIPDRHFGNYGNCCIMDQCLRGSPSLFRFYCPQLSPFIVPPMFSFPDVPGSCFTAEKNPQQNRQSPQY